MLEKQLLYNANPLHVTSISAILNFQNSKTIAICLMFDRGCSLLREDNVTALMSTQTYYTWKSKYGGMSVSDIKRLKELEDENAKLKSKFDFLCHL